MNDFIDKLKEYWIQITVAVVSVAAISFLIWNTVHTDPLPAYVQDKTWVRSLETEEYRWVNDYDSSRISYPSAPIGARNIRHNHYTTTDHHPAQYRTETYYTGSGEDRTSHTRQVMTKAAWTETIHHYETHYEIQRWVFDQKLVLSGGATEEPIFPTCVTDATHRERSGSRVQTYTFTLQIDNAKKEIKTFTTDDFNLYKKSQANDGFIAYINGWGFVTSVKRFDGSEIAMMEDK